MVATIVTHMMISLNNHVGRTPNTNASYKKVATLQQYENVSEIKYRSVIEPDQSPPGGPQSFQYDLVEPAISVGAGTIVRVKNAVRTISEPAKTITETLAKKVTHLIAEPAKTITENLVKAKTANRSLVEPANAVGESINKIAHKVRTISEPANIIGESLISSKHYNRTINESAISVTDSLVKIAHKVRQITEPPTNITEALTHIRIAELAESPISITESLQANRIFSRGISESVFVGGSSYTFAPASFTRASFINAADIVDVLTKKVTHNLAQTTAITENLVKLRIAVRNLSENVPLQPEIVQRLVTHYMNETVPISESLVVSKTVNRIISEPPVSISELLTVSRQFKRSINPVTFTSESFTTGAFESFNVPSGDAVEITEELEGFVLPYWQKVLIEPAIEITESLEAVRQFIRTITEDPITIGESLTATKSLAPPISIGGVSRRRRRQQLRYPLFRQIPKQPIPKPEPEHEPLLFEVELTEQPIAIQESLTAVKIIKEKQIISVAAAAPPPEIIEKEKIVYVDRIVEKEILVQPPPIIKAQDVIVSKPKPIEVEQEILVSTQAHSNKMKSKAASAQLQILEELMSLAEMEETV